ncbi:hypothetical protein GCM10010384_66190 [Streptomyces djakartensis]|uniref:Uncharacterized protein n=1 Tax=Streptomyces djakartensis TaxID=68193 RepID=A0ABQ3AF75_9ACTN|nr:hypothetical protein GCM10010384_66190 [Streptomyces djakartensis]
MGEDSVLLALGDVPSGGPGTGRKIMTVLADARDGRSRVPQAGLRSLWPDMLEAEFLFVRVFGWPVPLPPALRIGCRPLSLVARGLLPTQAAGGPPRPGSGHREHPHDKDGAAAKSGWCHPVTLQ